MIQISEEDLSSLKIWSAAYMATAMAYHGMKFEVFWENMQRIEGMGKQPPFESVMAEPIKQNKSSALARAAAALNANRNCPLD